jgi:alanine racemase
MSLKNESVVSKNAENSYNNHEDVAYSRTFATISKAAISHNFNAVKELIPSAAKIMAIVKANAYGHGIVETSKIFEEVGAYCLGVASVQEALKLRSNNIKIPILVLGYTPPECFEAAIQEAITLTVFDYSYAEKLSQKARELNKQCKIHIKIDTGMNRLGIYYSDSPDIVIEINKLKNIEIEGIFSHLASADESDESFSLLQFERFQNFVKKLELSGLHIPIKHIAASAAILKFPQMHLDMVRMGIIGYGVMPSDIFEEYRDLFTPAMQIKSHIFALRTLRQGDTVSYGRIFTAPHDMRIATIPIGYGDGLVCGYTNKINILIRGKKVFEIGKICMDQCMIDVTNVNDISVGDSVTIVGSDGGEIIRIEDLASALGTTNHEPCTILSSRVPRKYD